MTIEQLLAGLAARGLFVNNAWQRIDETWNVRLRRDGTIVADADGQTLAEALEAALRAVQPEVDIFA